MGTIMAAIVIGLLSPIPAMAMGFTVADAEWWLISIPLIVAANWVYHRLA